MPTADDVTMSCSCPDWANPCKHIAAVYYLLAEEFDRDPFQTFTLRGRSVAATATEEPLAPEETPEPLEGAVDDFWEPREKLTTFHVAIKPPEVEGERTSSTSHCRHGMYSS